MTFRILKRHPSKGGWRFGGKVWNPNDSRITDLIFLPDHPQPVFPRESQGPQSTVRREEPKDAIVSSEAHSPEAHRNN